MTSQAKKMTLKVEPLKPTTLELSPQPNTTSTNSAIREDARRTYAEVLIRNLRNRAR